MRKYCPGSLDSCLPPSSLLLPVSLDLLFLPYLSTIPTAQSSGLDLGESHSLAFEELSSCDLDGFPL